MLGLKVQRSFEKTSSEPMSLKPFCILSIKKKTLSVFLHEPVE